MSCDGVSNTSVQILTPREDPIVNEIGGGKPTLDTDDDVTDDDDGGNGSKMRKKQKPQSLLSKFKADSKLAVQ